MTLLLTVYCSLSLFNSHKALVLSTYKLFMSDDTFRVHNDICGVSGWFSSNFLIVTSIFFLLNSRNLLKHIALTSHYCSICHCYGHGVFTFFFKVSLGSENYKNGQYAPLGRENCIYEFAYVQREIITKGTKYANLTYPHNMHWMECKVSALKPLILLWTQSVLSTWS